MKWNRKGFTLIELLVVIAIIAIISAIAIIQFGNATADARDARRQADIRSMQSALELFYNANNRYPGTDGATGTLTWVSIMLALEDYLASPIEDPQSGGFYIYCTNSGAADPNTDYLIVADLEGADVIGGDVDAETWGVNDTCERSSGDAGFTADNAEVDCLDANGGFCIGDQDPAS